MPREPPVTSATRPRSENRSCMRQNSCCGTPFEAAPRLRLAWGVRTRLRRRQLIALECLAQPELVDLAGGGMGGFLHHLHVVGHPPFRDPWLQIVEDLLGLRRMPFLRHDDEERPLVPFRVGDA